ncbi:MAG: NADH-quinone oxidoreductase subunit A [Candidatus Bathyarchaeota archaeon]|nr:NADH-quinone oxidoreductase subunit A [Candidatus Bathyarchaeota archaeon]
MLIETTLSFLLIVAATSIIYLIGRRAAPKTVQTVGERSVYACGEKVAYPKLKVNISLYKYLIYFVILDSAVLLLAYAAFAEQVMNTSLLLLYLFMALISAIVLFEGGKD